MDASTEQRAAPERASERRGAAFRVCTVDDFEPNRLGTPGRRKSGQPSTACQSCRSRKIKCILQDARQSRRPQNETRCAPCEQSDLQCRWDGIDRRRRRYKSRPVALIRAGNDSNGTNAQLKGEYAFIHTGTGSSPTGQEHQGYQGDGHGRVASPKNLVQGSDLSKSPGQFQWLTGGNSQFDGAQLQPSEPFLAELYPEGDLELSQDWPDLQNFILGLDFLGQDGAPSVQPAETTANGQPTLRTLSSRPRLVRLRYYRRFGPTAVIPGLRRLSVVVDPDQEESPGDGEHHEADRTPSSGHNSTPGSTTSSQSRLFDKLSREPHPDMVPQILDVFFDYFGGHFPFLHPQILGGHVRSGEASSFLLNAVAALTVRFCPLEGPLAALHKENDVPWRRGAPFLKKAKEQIMPLLSIPAPEVVAGLLALAWAEFGDNNEAGLWMFAGMAIRMAQDLGLHRTPDPDIDPNTNFHDHARPSPDGGCILTDEQSLIHQKKARLVMFWSVFIMDVCVSLVTGRPPTIRRGEIEVPIPTAHDMKLAQLDFSENVSMQNLVFPEMVRFMLRFSAILEELNQRYTGRSPKRNPDQAGTDDEAHLSQLRSDMVHDYSSLQSSMTFNTDNFREAAVSRQSGLFLMLHLFFYTFMTLLSSTSSRDARHGLRQAQSRRSSAPNCQSEMRSATLTAEPEQQPKIALTACQKMVQVITVADLVDKVGYLGTPFINHCLFVAASTILQGSDALAPNDQGPMGNFSSVVADTDYEFLHRKLQEHGHYFGAINSVVSVLEQRKRASVDGEENRAQASDEEPEGGIQRVVGLGDSGIVNRYTIPCP